MMYVSRLALYPQSQRRYMCIGVLVTYCIMEIQDSLFRFLMSEPKLVNLCQHKIPLIRKQKCEGQLWCETI